MNNKIAERNAEILRLRLEEYWLQKDIADKFGISNSRVGQILNMYGHYNNPLTIKQRKKQVYDFIIFYKRTHCGCSPSSSEIEKNCSKVANKPLVEVYIRRLVEDGVLWKPPFGHSTSVEVAGARWIPPNKSIQGLVPGEQ